MVHWSNQRQRSHNIHLPTLENWDPRDVAKIWIYWGWPYNDESSAEKVLVFRAWHHVNKIYIVIYNNL